MPLTVLARVKTLPPLVMISWLPTAVLAPPMVMAVMDPGPAPWLQLVAIKVPPLTVNTLLVALPLPIIRDGMLVAKLLVGTASQKTALKFTLTCKLPAPLPTYK